VLVVKLQGTEKIYVMSRIPQVATQGICEILVQKAGKRSQTQLLAISSTMDLLSWHGLVQGVYGAGSHTFGS
jgi:hypothetical protein